MDAIGDTFIVPNPCNGKEHLYIVIALDDGGNPIAANLTSTCIERSNCILQPGDHPWITKESGVNFWDVRRPMDLTALRQGEQQGLVRRSVPVSAAVVRRIVDAAHASLMFPEKLKSFLTPF